MIKVDEKSNAQSWELEVTCKNKKYLGGLQNQSSNCFFWRLGMGTNLSEDEWRW